MSEPAAPFAISPDGGTLVAGDGPELLAWRADGAPHWKQFTDGVLIGVLATQDVVFTLSADGRLGRWRRIDGEPLDPIDVSGRCLALVGSPDGVTVAVLTEQGPVVISPLSPPRVLPVAGASACAFGPGGNSVGVGTTDGTFVAIELLTGAAWGSVPLGGPAAGVAWSSLGSWIVGTGRTLLRISGDGARVEASIGGADHPMDLVACAANGLIVAARAGDRVELYELHANRPIGEFVLRRPIGGLCFGPGLLLGIGLDDGDANVVELAGGATFRTEPHPGRARNTWRLENRVDPGAVRGAIAMHQAGGQPIARFVPRPDADEQQGGCLYGCLSVASVVLILTLFCAGIGVLMYVLKTYDLWRYLPLR